VTSYGETFKFVLSGLRSRGHSLVMFLSGHF